MRNAVLVGLAGLCAVTPHARPLVWVDAVTVAGGALALALVYAAVDLALAHAASPVMARAGSPMPADAGSPIPARSGP